MEKNYKQSVLNCTVECRVGAAFVGVLQFVNEDNVWVQLLWVSCSLWMKILNLVEHGEATKSSDKGGHVNNNSSTPSTAVYCCRVLLRFVTATTHNQHTYPQNKQAYYHLLAELMITDNIHTGAHKNSTHDNLKAAKHSQLNWPILMC
jgi:hypothetical protein